MEIKDQNQNIVEERNLNSKDYKPEEQVNSQNNKSEIHASNIDKNIIVNGLGKLFIGSNEEKPQNREFKDPTFSIDLPDEYMTFLSTKEIANFQNRLVENRLLIIECTDDDTLNSITYSIAGRFKEHQKRKLLFDDYSEENNNIQIKHIIEEKIGQGKYLLIVVKLNFNSSRFLGSLREDIDFANNLKLQLKEKNILILCQLSSDLGSNIYEKKQKSKFFFDYEQIILPSEKQNVEPQYKEIISENAINKEILFVITYFSGISPKEFDKIVRFLLQNKTESQETIRQIVDNEGNIKTIKENFERKLVEIWNNENDIILRKNNIEIRINQDKTLCCDVNNPLIVKELESYFVQNPFYVNNQFELLLFNSDFLLNVKIFSKRLNEKILGFCIQQSLIEPESNGLRLLKYISELYNQNEYIRSKLEKFLNILLINLLNYEQFISIINRYFDFLLDKNKALLLNLLIQMPDNQINKLDRIKRLFNSENFDIRIKAYMVLFNSLRYDLDIYDTLICYKVHFEKSLNLENKTNFDQGLLTLFFDYVNSTINYSITEDSLNRDALFKPLFDLDSLKIQNNISLLFYWLLNPNFDKFLLNLQHNELFNSIFKFETELMKYLNIMLIEKFTIELRTRIIEYWFFVLQLFEDRNLNENIQIIIQIFLQELNNNKDFQRKLKGQLLEENNLFITSKVDYSDRLHNQYITIEKIKYKNRTELIKRMNNIQKQIN